MLVAQSGAAISYIRRRFRQIIFRDTRITSTCDTFPLHIPTQRATRRQKTRASIRLDFNAILRSSLVTVRAKVAAGPQPCALSAVFSSFALPIARGEPPKRAMVFGLTLGETPAISRSVLSQRSFR